MCVSMCAHSQVQHVCSYVPIPVLYICSCVPIPEYGTYVCSCVPIGKYRMFMWLELQISCACIEMHTLCGPLDSYLFHTHMNPVSPSDQKPFVVAHMS